MIPKNASTACNETFLYRSIIIMAVYAIIILQASLILVLVHQFSWLWGYFCNLALFHDNYKFDPWKYQLNYFLFYLFLKKYLIFFRIFIGRRLSPPLIYNVLCVPKSNFVCWCWTYLISVNPSLGVFCAERLLQLFLRQENGLHIVVCFPMRAYMLKE